MRKEKEREKKWRKEEMRIKKKIQVFFLKLGEEDLKFWYNVLICCFKIGFYFDVSKKLWKIWGTYLYFVMTFFSFVFVGHLCFSFIVSLLQFWFISVSFGFVFVLTENVFGHTF